MAQLIDIQRVEIGPQNLTARVRLAPEAPLMTSEDLEATTRVYRLLPHIIEHACLGDRGETFKECMGDTELAHLLEHVAVELLAQTNVAGDITSGKTYQVDGDDRAFDVQISCSDDVLTVAALSSAAWIVDWAFNGGGEPKPDVAGIVAGLVDFVNSLGEAPADEYEREVQEEIATEVEAERARLMQERAERLARERAEAERIAAERAAQEAAERAEAELRMRVEEERLAEEARRAEEERLAQEAAEREAAAAAEAAERAAIAEREAAEAAAAEAARIEAEIDAVLGENIVPFAPAPAEPEVAPVAAEPAFEPEPEPTAVPEPEPADELEPEPIAEPEPAGEPESEPAVDSAALAYDGHAVSPEALKAIEQMLGVPVRFVGCDTDGAVELAIGADDAGADDAAADDATGETVPNEDMPAESLVEPDAFVEPADQDESDVYVPSHYKAAPEPEDTTFCDRVRAFFGRLTGPSAETSFRGDNTASFEALPSDDGADEKNDDLDATAVGTVSTTERVAEPDSDVTADFVDASDADELTGETENLVEPDAAPADDDAGVELDAEYEVIAEPEDDAAEVAGVADKAAEDEADTDVADDPSDLDEDAESVDDAEADDADADEDTDEDLVAEDDAEDEPVAEEELADDDLVSEPAADFEPEADADIEPPSAQEPEADEQLSLELDDSDGEPAEDEEPAAELADDAGDENGVEEDVLLAQADEDEPEDASDEDDADDESDDAEGPADTADQADAAEDFFFASIPASRRVR